MQGLDPALWVQGSCHIALQFTLQCQLMHPLKNSRIFIPDVNMPSFLSKWCSTWLKQFFNWFFQKTFIDYVVMYFLTHAWPCTKQIQAAFPGCTFFTRSNYFTVNSITRSMNRNVECIFFFVLMDFRTGPQEDTIILQTQKAITLVVRKKKMDLSFDCARKG